MAADPIMVKMKARRLCLGMTLQQVENRSGLRLQQVSLWERGVQLPHLNNLRRWCDALGLEPAVLPKGAPDDDA